MDEEAGGGRLRVHVAVGAVGGQTVIRSLADKLHLEGAVAPPQDGRLSRPQTGDTQQPARQSHGGRRHQERRVWRSIGV